MKTIDLISNTDEWLKWRADGIGASDCPALMNISTYPAEFTDGSKMKSNALSLWYEKTKIKTRKPPNDFILTMGHAAEVKVRAMYELETGRSFPSLLAELEGYNFIRASLDGYNETETVAEGGLRTTEREAIEIKMVGAEVLKKAKEEGFLPDKFKFQGTHQMIVTGLDQITFLLCPTPDKKKGIVIDHYVKVIYKKDEELTERILKAIVDFWNCVKKKKKPEVKNPEIKKLVRKWKTLKKQQKALDAKAKNKKSEVETIESDLSKLVPAGSSFFSLDHIIEWAEGKKGNVDYMTIPAVQEMTPEELDKYRKEKGKDKLSISPA